MANAPSPFSSQVPQLQLALDSTSLGEFKTCPRKYQYRILEGWIPRQQSIHLTFGLLLHSSVEYYHFQRALGIPHEDSLDQTVQFALASTWDTSKARPIELNDSAKNRISLLRALVWYLDQWPQGQGDPLKTVIKQDGRPAVELSFEFDSGYETQDGEAIYFCGHLDRVVELNGDLYISDIKTTGYSLDGRFFSQFNPDNQMYMYALAGQITLTKAIAGVIIDGMQIGAGYVRNQRHMLQISASALAEWYDEQEDWLHLMYRYARNRRWPKNDKACNMYGGCSYRSICGRSPEVRQQWLESEFTREMWNPLEKRGDI